MISHRILLAGLLGAACAVAQQTSITGRITDETQGAVAGAKVRASVKGGGASYATLTNDLGVFQFPSVAANDFVVRVEYPGFTPAEKSFSLLVGQTARIDIQLKPSAVSTTVEVQENVGAIDVTSSQVAGNIDPGQMQNTPLNSRNWMELSLLVPGITRNSVDFIPLGNASSGKFQINVDGQHVTQNTAVVGFGQPQYSRDAMSQFQINI